MRYAVHAEWTKLRTRPGTAWQLVAIVALTVALSAAAAAAVNCPSAGCDHDPVKISLTGVLLGQAVVAILAVLAVSDEYGTGMIRITLSAMPRRWDALIAKATVVGGVVLAAGTVAVLGSLLAGRLILPGGGFNAAHGFASLSLADGSTQRAAVGSVIYLVLVSLLSLGIATAVRESATAIGAALGLLYLFPIFVEVVRDPDWQRHLRQIAPLNAGLAIQSTTDLASLPIGPWAGIGVLAGWAMAALVAGASVLWLRDA